MEHCDFLALRNMLLRTHMQDLKDITNSVHYENFRCRKLAGVGSDGKPARLCNKNPLDQLEEEKKEHENKMKRMEQEMEQVFELKVKEKRQKLKDSEQDLQRRHEQIRLSLAKQAQELEEMRKAFEKEKKEFELTNKDVEDAFKRMTMDNNSKELQDKHWSWFKKTDTMFPMFHGPPFSFSANSSPFTFRMTSKTNVTWFNIRRVVIVNEGIKLVFLVILVLFVMFLCCKECDMGQKLWAWLMALREQRSAAEQRRMVIPRTDARNTETERAAGDTA
ncbi:Protein peanut like protein [Argiope bruennichi]|uniref:Protein peanut like protein n=1 Tax=Argiope bruennichi TaxID=94029 RepID=A0A8T0F4V4_ARGBR|nr:Protein peanut like protein [Argiope bruennichi]